MWQTLWLRAKQRYGEFLKKLFRHSFLSWQRLGFHLTLNHYYEPVPDTSKLKEELWTTQSELPGLDMKEEVQVELLSLFAARFKAEYDAFPVEKTDEAHRFYLNNGGFPSVDAEILYCMIRHLKPRYIMEIGSGSSTCLSAQAVLKNRDEDSDVTCELIAIEPYPNEVLKRGFPGLSRLIQRQAQEVPLEEFQRLHDNDILFIDSSHMLKIGSDVQYEYLELLPRLQKGVVVHIHDIHFPMEYPKAVVTRKHRFWNEQYLFQAFLAFNSSFHVLWGGNFMHVRHPDALASAFQSYDPAGRWPSSLWIRRVA